MAENNNNNVVVDFNIVWLDSSIETTKANRDTKALIRQIVRNRLKTFDNADECVDYITTESTQRIFLIISNSFGQYVVPLIYQSPYIQNIYVYCGDRQRAEKWAQPNLKVSGIFTERKALINKIQDDLRAYDKDSHLPMSVFHLEEQQNSLQDLTEESATFMWYKLVLVVLRRMTKFGNSKTEMIAECRLPYHDDEAEKKKINKFEETYIPSKAIWWYTCDCFVYRLLNKALRTQNIEIIFKFRFLINDLHNQIKQLYQAYLVNQSSLSEHRLTVYRGQHLHINELDTLKHNVNGLISMNTFLSATLNRNLALIFADTGNKCNDSSPIQGVLFIIEVYDMCETSTPFAPIRSVSCYEEEDEVLFTISAIFKVQSVEQHDNMWHVHLQLSKQQNQLCQDLSRHMMKQIGSEPSPLTLGWFLYRMSDFSKAERYAQLLLKQLPPSDREVGNIYNLLGLIYKDTGNPQQAVEYYEKALDIYSHKSSYDSTQVIATHYNLGLAYLALDDNRRADEHRRQAEGILINSSQPDDSLLVAMTDVLKAKVQTAHGDYSSASKSLEKALKTKKMTLPPGNPSIASTLKDIGIVQEKMGNDQEALDYFKQALEIGRKSLSSNHFDLGEYHTNIGRIYYKREEYTVALKHFETALNIIGDTERDCEKVSALNQFIEETKEKLKKLKVPSQ